MQKSILNNNSAKKAFQSVKFSTLFILLFGLKISIFAQEGSVGIGTNTPNVNAVLDVTSTTKGVLLPRLTQDQRTTLTPLLNLATNGLLIYNVTTLRFNYWNGTQWNDVGIAGANGANGANGAEGTIWYADALPPQTLPSNTLGKPNDFFLDGVTGDVYKKDISNTWVRFSGPNLVNLKNPNTRKIQIANGPAFIVRDNSAQVVNFTFMGAAVGDVVYISPNFALPNGLSLSYARVVSADTIEVKFYNSTSNTLTIASSIYDIAIIKS